MLANVLLKTEDAGLKLTATNLEIGINSWVPGKVTEEGEIKASPMKAAILESVDALIAETAPEFCALFFGTVYAGAWPVPLPLPTSFSIPRILHLSIVCSRRRRASVQCRRQLHFAARRARRSDCKADDLPGSNRLRQDQGQRKCYAARRVDDADGRVSANVRDRRAKANGGELRQV